MSQAEERQDVVGHSGTSEEPISLLDQRGRAAPHYDSLPLIPQTEEDRPETVQTRAGRDVLPFPDR